MRTSICCLFHFFIIIFFFLVLHPNAVAVVPVPVPYTYSSSLSSRISSLNHSNYMNDHSCECDALLLFGNSFTLMGNASSGFCRNASYARTASWKEGGADCCSWDGVICDPATGHVIGLDLSCSWLQGPILSNSSLFSLRNLRRLNLAGNHFSGSQIPSRFGIFTEMTHLNLSSSGFKGQVPLDLMISHFSGLITLDLSHSWSDLTMEDGGDLGRVLQNLTQLRVLVLDDMDLSRIDPISLTNLSSTLTVLSLESCNLQGTFPIDFFNLPNLRILDLSYNFDLSGTLPLTNWSGLLVSLDISIANFQGALPTSAGNLTYLNHLVLSDNNLSGPIPPTLCKLTRLVWLDLEGNHFSGTTVDLLLNKNCSMPRLQHLSLRNCGLSRFPYFLSSSVELTLLDLSYNNISGSIPAWFWSVGRDTLATLDLTYNNFSGEMPHSVCQMRSLKYMRLSYNTLNGTLPTCLGNVSDFVVLDFVTPRFRLPKIG